MANNKKRLSDEIIATKFKRYDDAKGEKITSTRKSVQKDA